MLPPIIIKPRPNTHGPSAIKTVSPKKRSHASLTLTREHRLLMTSPETDDPINLEASIDSTSAEPQKKKRRSNGRKSTTSGTQDPETPLSALEKLPSDLLKVAQQPQVRGGAFVLGGVSGNIGTVSRARRLVHQILQGENTANDWEKIVFGENPGIGLQNVVVQLEGRKKSLPALVCPDCQSAI